MTAPQRVAVWPVRRSPPWAYPASDECLTARCVPQSWPALPLLEALRRQWDRDSWFQAVTVERCPSWPRLRKVFLLEERSRSTGMSYAVVDLDRPDHHTDPWPTAELAAEAVAFAAERLDASVYATRGGLRAVWALPAPVPLRLAQSYIDQLHLRIPLDLPVPLDRGVKDWTRGYRLPWCPRYDGVQAAWGTAAPPSDLRRLEAGQVLELKVELQEEEATRVRRVVWPAPAERPTSAERRIEGVAKSWVRKVEAASSRHAVLLAAGRHVGGLCARYGVSPERFVEALAACSSSGNARKTVQAAVDFGAHSPVELPPDRENARLEQAYARVR